MNFIALFAVMLCLLGLSQSLTIVVCAVLLQKYGASELIQMPIRVNSPQRRRSD
jgi:hypothetical protein